jgi:dipeptidyl aminopeptidase/acylaminoacyl peptidase
MHERSSRRVGSGLVLAGVVLAALSARAAPQDAIPARTLRLADYYDLEELGSVTATPDGSRVIFTRARPDAEEDARRTSIWSAASSGADLRRLVEEGSSPRLTPDGRLLAYLHKSQVWVLTLPDGEPWRVTGLPGGVADFDWAPDGSALVVASTEPPEPPGSVLPPEDLLAIEQERQLPEEVELPPLDAGEWVPAEPAEPPETAATAETTAAPIASGPYPTGVMVPPADPEAAPERPLPVVITRLQFKADGQGYIGVRPRHLFVVDVPPAPAEPVPARRLTGSEFSDGAPRWSPDGRWIAFSSKRSRNPDTNDNADIWLVPPTGGEPVQVTTSPGQDGTPRWSPDGTHLAYRHVPEDPPVYANATLRMVRVRGAEQAAGSVPTIGEPVDLTAALDRPVAAAPVWAADGASFYTRLDDRGMVSLIRFSSGLERAG